LNQTMSELLRQQKFLESFDLILNTVGSLIVILPLLFIVFRSLWLRRPFVRRTSVHGIGIVNSTALPISARRALDVSGGVGVRGRV
jgi:hypothetical protein